MKVKMKRNSGQAMIMVLILLAVGTLFVMPSIDLTSTSLISTGNTIEKTKELYAADGGQQYILWKLVNQYSSMNLSTDVPYDFSLDVCGLTVNGSLIMRAVASWQGVTLINDTPIKPTKTVSPDTDPGGAVVNYIIRLERIATNMTEGLDAVYDILASDFDPDDYVTGSTRLRVDGGAWQDIVGDPLIEEFGGTQRLRWPASGNFSSPIRDFAGGQVKELSFNISSSGLKNNRTYFNWVVLKPWNTISGAVAPITTGDGSGPEGGLIKVETTVTPSIIIPGEVQDVLYTVNITNQKGSSEGINYITAYLAEGFAYLGPTSGVTTDDPSENYTEVNGVYRWKLDWNEDKLGGGLELSSGESVLLNFWARSSSNTSGSYFLEVTANFSSSLPNEFSSLNLTKEMFNSGYTWNSAPVMIPSFDSRTQAGSTNISSTIDANLSVGAANVSIMSWSVK